MLTPRMQNMKDYFWLEQKKTEPINEGLQQPYLL